MKAASLYISILFVIGCGNPKITSVLPDTASLKNQLFRNKHIIYSVPPQFSISRNKKEEVTIVFKANHDFGIDFAVPKVAKDRSKSPSEIISNIVPILRKDLEREGKGEVQTVTRAFGNNKFYGFSYKDKIRREILDGFLTVGKSFIPLQIFWPLDSDLDKNQVIRKEIQSILGEIKRE